LRHDVDHRRRRVGIGLDIELLECDQAADHHDGEQAYHQIAAADCDGDEAIHSDRSFQWAEFS
jgi:hypothetical protein